MWKTPTPLDRCSLSPQSKLDGHGLIHLKAQRGLCTTHTHTHTYAEVCTYTLHLCSILTPLNHVMWCVSRHLDPPQADLDNGSVVLQHLTLSVSVCVFANGHLSGRACTVTSPSHGVGGRCKQFALSHIVTIQMQPHV